MKLFHIFLSLVVFVNSCTKKQTFKLSSKPAMPAIIAPATELTPSIPRIQGYAAASGNQIPGSQIPGTIPPINAVVPGNYTNTFSSEQDVLNFVSGEQYAWVVTAKGHVYRTRIAPIGGGTHGPTKEWQLPNFQGHTSGSRTYVSEIGLIIGRTIDGIYRVNDDTPAPQLIYDLKGLVVNSIGSNSRVCVTSFRANNKSYIGAAYCSSSGGDRFIRFPIDNTKSTKVDTSPEKIEEVFLNYDGNCAYGDWGGYSCFVDQARNHFWIGLGTGLVRGVDLNNMTLMQANTAPNSNITGSIPELKIDLTTDADRTGPKTRYAYTIAGDAYGNVLRSTNNIYTFAHDALNDIVFATDTDWNARDTNSAYDAASFNIYVVKGKCLRQNGLNAECTQQHYKKISRPEKIQALSSLNDGRIIGLNSKAPPYTNYQGPWMVYLISLTDKNNIANTNLNIEKILTVDGDPYMYTDFTGATMYPKDDTKTFTFGNIVGHVKNKPILQLNLKWTEKPGHSQDFFGLGLYVRCYLGSSGAPGYTKIPNVPKANILFGLNYNMCKGNIDTIDVQIKGELSNNYAYFSRLKNITLIGYQ